MKNLVVNSKNYIEDFVKVHLFFEKGNKQMKIGRDEMLEKYKDETKDLKMTSESLLPKLKFDYGMDYDSSSLRCNGNKGVWYGVRFRTSEEVKEIQNNDGGTSNYIKDETNQELFTLTDSKELNNLRKENDELKKKLAEMEILLKKKNEQEAEEEDDEIVLDTESEQDDEEKEPDLPSYTKPNNHDKNLADLFSQLI
jgi:hypothetical protein